MFGHDDDDKQKQNDNSTVTPATSTDNTATVTDDSAAADPLIGAGDVNNSTATTGDKSTNSPDPADTPISPAPADLNLDSDSSDSTIPDSDTTSTPTSDSDSPVPATAYDEELLSIRKNVLQDLSPIVDKLDQSPEDKFRTTMMMIQTSDDKSLIKRAYDAAKAITDEKARAQALLDVAEEINYFTQPKEDN